MCAIVHRLLFNQAMDLACDDVGCWRIVQPLRRYWQVDLWQSLFTALLNAAPGTTAPLADLRHTFETYLTANAFKAKAIKQMIVKQEAKLFEA